MDFWQQNLREILASYMSDAIIMFSKKLRHFCYSLASQCEQDKYTVNYLDVLYYDDVSSYLEMCPIVLDRNYKKLAGYFAQNIFCDSQIFRLFCLVY